MQVSAINHAPASARAQATQRLKVGLIGLAAVLLLIGLASAVFNSVNRERPVTAIGGARPATVAEIANAATPATGNEPLAELGVAPPTAPEPGNRVAVPRR